MEQKRIRFGDVEESKPRAGLLKDASAKPNEKSAALAAAIRAGNVNITQGGLLFETFTSS